MSEGLKKIKSGKLAPEALQLVAVRRKDQRGDADPNEPEDGWLLRLAGRRVEAQLYRQGGGYDDRLYSDVRRLTKKILESGRVAPAAD